MCGVGPGEKLEGAHHWLLKCPTPGKQRRCPAMPVLEKMGALEEAKGQSNAKRRGKGTSLAVQWLGLHASTAGGIGLIPGRGTKIP